MDEKNLTPAMQQYFEIKNQYSDSVIFFRMGDFYEMFGEDAKIAHKVLGITITSRNKNSKSPELLAGFPYHAKEKYLPLLIKAGYKVAIVEQVSDPKLKGIVKREVVRVVTPSTIGLESDLFDDFSDSNIIISIVKENFKKQLEEEKNILNKKFGISILNITTNKWESGEFENFSSLANEIYKISPKEVVLEKELFSNDEIKDLLSKKYGLNVYFFDSKKDCKKNLLNHFQVKDLSGFGIEDMELAIKSSSLLLDYLELNQKQNLTNFNTISILNTKKYLVLDNSTIKNLDLVYNLATQSDSVGTLFGVLNQTKTSMGKRLLKENILYPLNNIEEINNRLDLVEEFLKDKILLDKLREHLSYISDLDAILNRLALERITPRDLLNLKKSLESALKIFEIIQNYDNKKIIKEILEK